MMNKPDEIAAAEPPLECGVMRCPFCGEHPALPEMFDQTNERGGYNFKMRIVCKCGANISRPSSSCKNGWCNDSGEAKRGVIAAWNSRA